MKDESLQPWIEPEMEARITALVLGESSDFEAEELHRLFEEKEELRIYHEKILGLHELLRSTRDDDAFDEEEWKLPDEKRDSVLSVLGRDPGGEFVVDSKKTKHVKWRHWKSALIASAACLVLGIGLALTFFSVASSEHRAGVSYGRDYAMLDSVEAKEDSLVYPGQSISSTSEIGQIHIEGNDKTKDYVVRRESSGSTLSSLDLAGGKFLTDEEHSKGRSERRQGWTNYSPLVADGDKDGIEVATEVEFKNETRERNYAAIGHGGTSFARGQSVPGEPSNQSSPTDQSIDEELEKPQSRTRAAGGAVVSLHDDTQVDASSVGTDSGEVRVTAGGEFRFVNPSEAAPIGHGGMTSTLSEQETNGKPVSELLPTTDDLVITGRLDASSKAGGTVSIGGSFQGRDASPKTRTSEVDYNSAARRDLSITPPVVGSNGAPPERPSVKAKVEKPSSGESLRLGFEIEKRDAVLKQDSPAMPADAEETEGLLLLTDAFGLEGEIAERNKSMDEFSFGDDNYKSDILHGGVSLSVDFGEESEPLPIEETVASEEPFSTFSLHVSDVSFKLAQEALSQGQWPEPDKVRIEEFVNAFDYNDPAPTQDEKVAARVEQAIHPFLQQRNLLRVSIRTAAAGRGASTPLRLTLLLDNSGSMARADRREIVRRAVSLLASQLQSGDSVTLISFARQPRLLAEGISADDASTLLDKVESLPSEGGTNLDAALTLAYEKAKENLVPGAQNRIVLLTDGAANLGDAKPENLTRRIELMRAGGVAFDAAGIGTGGLNDEVLEALTRKGDGRYYLLSRPEDADAGFAKQLAGAFRPAAGNVKVQLEFNPDRVGSYKLLGFEKHRLAKEDFRNDQVDAAELAAEEAGVAVYQFEPKAGGHGDVGSVSVRFRDMTTGEMVERRWPVLYQSNPPVAEEASESIKIALSAALLGAACKGGALGERVDISVLSGIVDSLPQRWKSRPRIAQLRDMLQKALELESSRPKSGGIRF